MSIFAHIFESHEERVVSFEYIITMITENNYNMMVSEELLVRIFSLFLIFFYFKKGDTYRDFLQERPLV